MTAAWPISGNDFSFDSRLAGEMFLPGGDDQLLLPVDDRQVAVVVEPADVARVHPSSGSSVSAVFSGSFR